MSAIDDMVWKLMALGGLRVPSVRVAMESEELATRRRVRARAVGHPEWENACSSCGCQMDARDGDTCYPCQLHRAFPSTSLTPTGQVSYTSQTIPPKKTC